MFIKMFVYRTTTWYSYTRLQSWLQYLTSTRASLSHAPSRSMYRKHSGQRPNSGLISIGKCTLSFWGFFLPNFCVWVFWEMIRIKHLLKWLRNAPLGTFQSEVIRSKSSSFLYSFYYYTRAVSHSNRDPVCIMNKYISIHLNYQEMSAVLIYFVHPDTPNLYMTPGRAAKTLYLNWSWGYLNRPSWWFSNHGVKNSSPLLTLRGQVSQARHKFINTLGQVSIISCLCSVTYSH